MNWPTQNHPPGDMSYNHLGCWIDARTVAKLAKCQTDKPLRKQEMNTCHDIDILFNQRSKPTWFIRPVYTTAHGALAIMSDMLCMRKLKDEEWARECTSVYAGVRVQFHKGQEKMDCCPTHHWFEPIKGFSFLVDNFCFSSSLKYCKIEDILPKH